MAEGVRDRAKTDFGLAVTGLAGPTGATPNKPIGFVVFALATEGTTQTSSAHFSGSREDIKFQASQKALDLLRQHLLSRI